MRWRKEEEEGDQERKGMITVNNEYSNVCNNNVMYVTIHMINNFFATVSLRNTSCIGDIVHFG